MTDKVNQVRFFEETFLLANVSPEIIFRIFFLTLSSINIDFLNRELRWRTYITKKTLPTTRHIKLVGKKEFAIATLNPEYKTFVIYVGSLNSTPLNIYFFRRPQISGLLAKEALTKVSDKYINFADVFSPDLASKLSKHTKINDYAIELVEGQQLFYGPIYSLEPIELETFKTYIETNLANRLIKLSKLSAGAPILFDWKPNGSLQLFIDYKGLNNLTIKNQYPLPLVGKSLDRLKRAKWFTQLDFSSIYHRMRICKEDE